MQITQVVLATMKLIGSFWICLLHVFMLTKCYGGLVDEPAVTTKLGTIIGQYHTTVVFGEKVKYETYLGIPYAEPPVGDLRFKKPVPKQAFSSPYKAIQFGNACYQHSALLDIVKGVTFGEDCLFLNVYVPFVRHERQAVMLFIHGGGFFSGASNTYPAHALVANGNVIVVTINYRLSLWGFLSTEDDHAAGNYGLFDQHLAIKWVHKNIKSFGGDPNRVTIFGGSAGSASVVVQSLYEENRGLFQRVIGQSGSISCHWASRENPRKDAETLGKVLGCESMESNALIKCLRNVPADTLYTTINDPQNGLVVYPWPFVPSIDGQLILDSPKHLMDNASNEQFTNSFFGSLEFLTGITSEEGLFFLLLPELGFHDTEHLEPTRQEFMGHLLPQAISYTLGSRIPDIIKHIIGHEYTDWTNPENMPYIRDNLVRLYSEVMFSIDMLKTIKLHSSVSGQSRKRYVYLFDIKPAEGVIHPPSWSKGAIHADELQYIFFNNTAGLMAALPGRDYYKAEEWEGEVAKYLVTMWTNFAKTG